MALNSSGPISLAGTTTGQSIEVELGGNGTTQISLNDSTVRTLAGVSSGAITMPTDFYGKANSFSFTISSNQTNANLRSLAIAAGWDGTVALTATLNSGIYISSNSTSTPALTISGSFPNGVSFINNGTVAGMGGAGANGGTAASAAVCYVGGTGSNGGLALLASSAVSITNNGIIAGGGGGGGGGGAQASVYAPNDSGEVGASGGGGGGGQGGLTSSSGGARGSIGVQQKFYGTAGNSGTNSAAGTGGAGNSYTSLIGNLNSSGAGGNGGGWGSSGSSGVNGVNRDPGNNSQSNGGSGGSGGAATSGSATYITWVATGTRYGTVG